MDSKNGFFIRLVNISKFFTPFSKKYRIIRDKKEKKRILDNINLDIRPGQTVTLLGKNGSGKTTLLKVCCGLLLPDQGRVIYGRPAPGVGFIQGESGGFYPRLTGAQNLDFFLALHGLRLRDLNERMQEILEFLELADILERPFQLMSTGEKQKLNIVLTLLIRSSLFLFDEPTKSLDPGSAEHIKNFVKIKLVKEMGHGVIWVTHNVHEALEMGDRVYVIRAGNIKEIELPATPERVLEEI
jgi:ABC-2 type transport system ATP-binding protein